MPWQLLQRCESHDDGASVIIMTELKAYNFSVQCLQATGCKAVYPSRHGHDLGVLVRASIRVTTRSDPTREDVITSVSRASGFQIQDCL